MGGFNNELQNTDRIGGRNIIEAEYKDLKNLMENAGLYEMDSRGEHFTWSNNQSEKPIYSRIYRLIGNMEWL